MDPIRNRTAQSTPTRSKRGTAWPAASAVATQVPDGFPPGSHRVPAARACSRQESEFRGEDAAPPGTGRNSRGTEWGLSRNRDHSGSSRGGTEWGLGPFTIEQTTEDVTAIHRLAASRLRGRWLSRHRPPAWTPSGDPRQGRRDGSVMRAGRASGRPRTRAPHSGGALGGHAGRRSAQTVGERDRRRCRRPRRPAKAALSRMAEGELAPAT